MAISNLPPAETAKQQQQASRLLRLKSNDPSERYQAQLEISGESAAAIGSCLMRQGLQTAKKRQELVKEYDRLDQLHSKYKPMKPGDIRNSK